MGNKKNNPKRNAIPAGDLCPSFGKDCDPRDMECAGCGLQVACVALMRGHAKLLDIAARDREGIAVWLDEVPPDIEPQLMEIVGLMDGYLSGQKKPQTEAAVGTLLAEELHASGLMDPWLNGWVTARVMERGWRIKDGVWVKP